MAAFQCQACGEAVPFDEPIPRDSECERCRRDLRCCMNCRHYDRAYSNACRETMADPVEDKARRNFCEYFSFTRTPYSAEKGRGKKEADARAKLEGLFGGGGGTARRDDARKRLDQLFGKKPGKAAEGEK